MQGVWKGARTSSKKEPPYVETRANTLESTNHYEIVGRRAVVGVRVDGVEGCT